MAIVLAAGFLLTASCNEGRDAFDASGAFEAEETIISAEAQGVLKAFDVDEGQVLRAGQEVGYIDSLQLYLKKRQLEARIAALLGTKPDIAVQLSALQEQLRKAETERQRIANLVKGDAATPKQLDDITSQITVLQRKIRAEASSLHISSTSIVKGAVPLELELRQVEDQLGKCRIVNPLSGTVLTKYMEANETAIVGKPLYKIADLSRLILRVYITGNQLPGVRLGQAVKVLTDDGKGSYQEGTGTITWISDRAEFTPKTIQTRDERADRVYAVKVRVNNDSGLYKIGMYGEIKLQ